MLSFVARRAGRHLGRQGEKFAMDAAEFGANLIQGEVNERVCKKVKEVTGVSVNPNHLSGRPTASGWFASAFTSLCGAFHKELATDVTTPNRLPSQPTMRTLGFDSTEIGHVDRARHRLTGSSGATNDS